MRRSIAFAVLSTALLALAGCKGPCRALSEKLCECETRPADKEQCLRDAASEESRVEPTAEQETFCQSKLETCDCKAIDTEEGKRACGLAR